MPALRLNRPTRAALACLVAVPLLVIAGLALLQLSPQLPLAGRYVGLCIVAYLTGSISWGYMVLVMARGEDIRDFGSGRTGMSNMLRTGGGKSAAIVFVLDCSKGILAVLLARYTIGVGAPEVVAALAVLCGHNWPVFLRFRGGRGILPSLGSLAVMAPWVALAGGVLFTIITLSSRYLSLGSIMGVMFIALLSLALTLWWGHHQIYTVYVFVGGAVIIWQHRDNIRRLLNGTERRVGMPGLRN